MHSKKVIICEYAVIKELEKYDISSRNIWKSWKRISNRHVTFMNKSIIVIRKYNSNLNFLIKKKWICWWSQEGEKLYK